MTPGARIEAAIALGAGIEATDAPADAVIARFFRGRRYMGSGDRRAVTDRVYGVLRRRARLDWWLERAGLSASPRCRVIADLVLVDGLQAAAVAALFDGGRHRPAPLAADEQGLVQSLAGHALDEAAMPDWVALEYPAWLDAPLRRQWGDSLGQEMAALNRPAPVDLRVNTVKATRAEAAAALAAEGIAALPTPLSPLGLRLQSRLRLEGVAAFRRGLVEVQDEGSQLVALLAGARPGMTVIDFCAGAGGKTLALAAAMTGDGGGVAGRLIACDASAARLGRMDERLHRAGIKGIERRPPAAEDEADRVLVDAPCSGSGTWRRHPDARWRLDAAGVDALVERQRHILADAAQVVRPGGRLVYATCSLLPAENEEQVRRFLEQGRDFAVVAMAEAWAATIGGRCPAAGPFLRLSPAGSGTDGFFAAVLERAGL